MVFVLGSQFGQGAWGGVPTHAPHYGQGTKEPEAQFNPHNGLPLTFSLLSERYEDTGWSFGLEKKKRFGGVQEMLFPCGQLREYHNKCTILFAQVMVV